MKLGKGVWRCVVACQKCLGHVSLLCEGQTWAVVCLFVLNSIPSCLSSALFCRELDPASYTPQNPANWRSIRSRQGDTVACVWKVGGGENPLRILSLLPAPCPAVEAAGGSGLQRCWLFQEQQPWASVAPGAFAVPAAATGGPRADADVDGSKESTALGHCLGSLFFWWQWLC